MESLAALGALLQCSCWLLRGRVLEQVRLTDLQAAFGDFDDIEYRARKIVGDMALALQASLLLRYGHPAVADAFCASRLGNSWGSVFGTLPRGVDVAPILERATVKIGA